MASSKMKLIGTFLALALSGVMAVAQMGCTTPEQRAALENFDRALTQDQKTLEGLYAEIQKYQDDLKAIWADIKAGKTPYETGLALASKVLANIKDVQSRIAETTTSIKDTQAAVAQLKAAGTPWYLYAMPVGTALLGIASMFVPGLSPLVTALQSSKTQLAATVSGVEQYRLAPDNDKREVEDFIQQAAKGMQVETDLNATVKKLTGSTADRKIEA